MDIITYSIPVFFVLILLEALLAWRLGRQVYRLNDSLNDLSCGIINQVVSFFTAAALLVPYAWLYLRGHWLELAEFSAPAWVLGLLGVDLAYYWFHRTVHEHNLLWGAHVVHHQSEEYNLTVALRQAAFEPWVSWIFRLPLALLGVPPLTVAACVAVDTVAQFWVHTRLIGKLGPLEWVLNTPSHHRVHHGRNPKYLDRNYGGMLIIWDRLFGTWQAEEEEPVYGVTSPLQSWNPVWANFRHISGVAAQARSLPSAWDRVQVWWQPPGWTPAGRNVSGAPLDAPKYDARPTSSAASVGVLLVAAAGLLVLLLGGRGLPPWVAAGLGGWVILVLLGLGGLQERRGWASPLLGGLLVLGGGGLAAALSGLVG